MGKRDKVDVQHVYTEVEFAMGSQFIRHALDDSEPIADFDSELKCVESQLVLKSSRKKTGAPTCKERRTRRRGVAMPWSRRKHCSRLARRSDEAIGVRVSVARIAHSHLDLERGVPTGVHPSLKYPPRIFSVKKNQKIISDQSRRRNNVRRREGDTRWRGHSELSWAREIGIAQTRRRRRDCPRRPTRSQLRYVVAWEANGPCRLVPGVLNDHDDCWDDCPPRSTFGKTDLPNRDQEIYDWNSAVRVDASLVKAVHNKVSTIEINLRKKSLLLAAYILTGSLSDMSPVKLVTMDGNDEEGSITYRGSLTNPRRPELHRRSEGGEAGFARTGQSDKTTPTKTRIFHRPIGSRVTPTNAASTKVGTFSTFVGRLTGRSRFATSSWPCKSSTTRRGGYKQWKDSWISGPDRLAPQRRGTAPGVSSQGDGGRGGGKKMIDGAIHHRFNSPSGARRCPKRLSASPPSRAAHYSRASLTPMNSVASLKQFRCASSEWHLHAVPRRGKKMRVRHWPVSVLASHQGEPGSIPGRITPGFSHVGIVPDDAAGRRVLSGISRFPSPFSYRHCSMLTSITLIGSQVRTVKSHLNLSTPILPLSGPLVHSLGPTGRKCIDSIVTKAGGICGPTIISGLFGSSLAFEITARVVITLTQGTAEVLHGTEYVRLFPSYDIVRTLTALERTSQGAVVWRRARSVDEDVGRLDRSLAGNASSVEEGRERRGDFDRVRSPAGSFPDFRKWDSCRTMPLIGGFYRGSPVSLRPFIPALHHAHHNHPHRLPRPRCQEPLTSLHSSLVDCESAWERDLSVIVPCPLRKIRYWSGRRLTNKLPGTDWRTVFRRVTPFCWRARPDIAVKAAVSPLYNAVLRAERLAFLPPIKANRVQSPAGPPPGFPMWKSCRTMPLVGGFSRGSPVYPPPFHSGVSPYSTRFALIGSQRLDVKSSAINLGFDYRLDPGSARLAVAPLRSARRTKINLNLAVNCAFWRFMRMISEHVNATACRLPHTLFHFATATSTLRMCGEPVTTNAEPCFVDVEGWITEIALMCCGLTAGDGGGFDASFFNLICWLDHRNGTDELWTDCNSW
ncbi:hypothetical protein PR048_032236 [Dryococelus australis]|uniref:Uncharacterized protein n=1 Tax=Dryococelus australis TaxID=614101 RepID=A0ABQ9G1M8_9NEOP|nr:hypothetical protein PR048_032236 [Dryococelus australis]